MVLIGSLSLSGCLVGTGPSEPVSLTFADGVASLVVCIDDIDVTGMTVSYKETEGVQSTAVNTSSRTGASGVILQYEDTMIIGEPLGGLEYSILQPLPDVSTFDTISASIEFELDGEWGYVWPTFVYVDRSELKDGQFMYSNGKISDHPCDMV